MTMTLVSKSREANKSKVKTEKKKLKSKFTFWKLINYERGADRLIQSEPQHHSWRNIKNGLRRSQLPETHNDVVDYCVSGTGYTQW